MRLVGEEVKGVTSFPYGFPPPGEPGLGQKGEPGPYGAATETELVRYLIRQLEMDAGSGSRIDMGDGRNHHTTVDAYALRQAIDALRHYEILLTKPLAEFVSPYFFHMREG